MTKNELHVLARQVMRDTNTNGDDTLTPWMVQFIERFGRFVTAHEREECAKVCETLPSFRSNTCDHFAFAIRERGDV